MRHHLATWRPDRRVWEHGPALVCGHASPYRAAWPRAGTLRGADAFAGGVDAPLLPTPLTTDVDAGRRPGRAQNLRITVEDAHQDDGRADSSTREAARLPTPLVTDHKGGCGVRRWPQLREAVTRPGWGRYVPALALWERLAGPVPAPTAPGRHQARRLAPA